MEKVKFQLEIWIRDNYFTGQISECTQNELNDFKMLVEMANKDELSNMSINLSPDRTLYISGELLKETIIIINKIT